MASPDESVTRRMVCTCSRSRHPARKVSHAVLSSSTNRARRSLSASERCTMRTRVGPPPPPPTTLLTGECAIALFSLALLGSKRNEITVPTGPTKNRTAASASQQHRVQDWLLLALGALLALSRPRLPLSFSRPRLSLSPFSMRSKSPFSSRRFPLLRSELREDEQLREEAGSAMPRPGPAPTRCASLEGLMTPCASSERSAEGTRSARTDLSSPGLRCDPPSAALLVPSIREALDRESRAMPLSRQGVLHDVDDGRSSQQERGRRMGSHKRNLKVL